MSLHFTKMHGLGNDFVVLDLVSQQASIAPDQIRRLSDRRFGIGFDQLLTVSAPSDPQADFKYTIYNADGSEAEQCGNGARCMLHFVRDRALTPKRNITLETNTGMIECRLEADDLVTVSMGAPTLDPARVPFVADEERLQHEVELPLDTPVSVSLFVVNMGNPHAVVTVDDVSTAPVDEWGKLLGCHPRFPEGVNLGFMEVGSRNAIKVRVHERGVGETLACGSGACAAVVAGRLQGLLDDPVTVALPGGEVRVAWPGDTASVELTGPATRVYEGRLEI